MIFPSNLGKYKIHITESPFIAQLQSSYKSITGLLEYVHITTIHLQSITFLLHTYYSPITILNP
jgi:hypothetical protein